MLTRTLVGHELGVWGLCLVSSGGQRLVDTDKSRAEKKQTRTTMSVECPDVHFAEGSEVSSKKHKKPRRPSKEEGVSSSQSKCTLRAGVTEVDLNLKLDERDGVHVMPSESLEFLVSPAMRIALGLDALTDSEREGGGGGGDNDEHLGFQDSTERHNHPRKEDRASSEDLRSIGQGRNPDKPSNMCYASEGWGQPNSLIVSGGCDKVVRVWDAESG